ncbi:MAG: carbonic anhydrase [Burkholderiales bacterium]|nr:carbonic anhydrase [Burkholderiales bacterium]
MKHTIDSLLAENRRFVAEQLALDPAYFEQLAEGQHPDFLWIGCSDSRVSPNLITGTGPGEMFVHRNIANLVVQTDMNLLSVLQYAVEVLHVNHVIVCGHHGCGGVKAAMSGHSGPAHGLVDHWLRTVKDTEQYFWRQLEPLEETARLRRLVELNVVEQVYNLGKTSIVQRAWHERRRPFIHGWVFDVGTGRIDPLTKMIDSDDGVQELCKFARGEVSGKVSGKVSGEVAA